MGAVDVRLPRVSDIPDEVAPAGFHSAIVDRYERRSKTQARLLCRLYLEGLASGDFEPVFRALHDIAVAIGGVLEPVELAKLVADHACGLLQVSAVAATHARLPSSATTSVALRCVSHVATTGTAMT